MDGIGDIDSIVLRIVGSTAEGRGTPNVREDGWEEGKCGEADGPEHVEGGVMAPEKQLQTSNFNFLFMEKEMCGAVQGQS
jgi:hypothetical protein